MGDQGKNQGMKDQVQLLRASSTSWQSELQRRQGKEPMVENGDSRDGGNHVISGSQHLVDGLEGKIMG